MYIIDQYKLTKDYSNKRTLIIYNLENFYYMTNKEN